MICCGNSISVKDAPLGAEGGLVRPAACAEDPFRALDELLAVVEALCPIWPQRGLIVTGDKMRL
jgi:hypothetical protein